jgi:hypothetical protein
VGKIASSNHSVSSILPVEIVAEIDSRRSGQSMTRSKYLGLIVAKWFADGCPAVNEADRAIKVMRAADKAGKQTTPKRTAA